ncbi:unnamed protein product [Symbiodinium sp. CCMP2456]|nr:unnamed protein product [Symbiodinium sp. CCMP2456]
MPRVPVYAFTISICDLTVAIWLKSRPASCGGTSPSDSSVSSVILERCGSPLQWLHSGFSADPQLIGLAEAGAVELAGLLANGLRRAEAASWAASCELEAEFDSALVAGRLRSVLADGAQTARGTELRYGRSAYSGGEDPGDRHEKLRAEAEARFFDSPYEADRVSALRHKFPRKKDGPRSGRRPSGETSEEEEPVRRRIAGFRLGFEKIFNTTSIRLPCSAYTVYAELRSSHTNEAFCRCFNGLHTVYDLKKWVYEKLMLPMSAYELSYAESGKVQLTDNMRLLTTQDVLCLAVLGPCTFLHMVRHCMPGGDSQQEDSLDSRSMATMRVLQDMAAGVPGVHSIGDIGVTRLYVRLKCRTCGDLLNSHSTCRKTKAMGYIEPAVNGMKPGSSKPSSSHSLKTLKSQKSMISQEKIMRGAEDRPHVSGPPKPDKEGWTCSGSAMTRLDMDRSR